MASCSCPNYSHLPIPNKTIKTYSFCPHMCLLFFRKRLLSSLHLTIAAQLTHLGCMSQPLPSYHQYYILPIACPLWIVPRNALRHHASCLPLSASRKPSLRCWLHTCLYRCRFSCGPIHSSTSTYTKHPYVWSICHLEPQEHLAMIRNSRPVFDISSLFSQIKTPALVISQQTFCHVPVT